MLIFEKACLVLSGISIFKQLQNFSIESCSNVVLPNQVALFVHDGD